MPTRSTRSWVESLDLPAAGDFRPWADAATNEASTDWSHRLQVVGDTWRCGIEWRGSAGVAAEGDAEVPSLGALLLAKASYKDSGVLAVISGVIPAPVTQKLQLGIRPAV